MWAGVHMGCAGTNSAAAEDPPIPAPVRPATLTGTAEIRGECSLPPGSELRVLLQDDASRMTPTGILARQRVPAEGPNTPFQLTYDLDRINIRRSYSVFAEVIWNGQRLYEPSEYVRLPSPPTGRVVIPLRKTRE